MPQAAVFLDRDGVINRAIVRDGKPFPPPNLAALEILPGVTEALEALQKGSYKLVVVTNQPDVARGTASRAEVEAIHAALQQQLPIDAFKTCYHDDTDHCTCRKPKPGALLEAAQEMNLDLAASFMVGDRWRDIEAGAQAGCRTFFVDYGYNERQPEKPTHRVASLLEAAHIILKEKS